MKSAKKLHKLIRKLGGIMIDSGDDGLACTIPRPPEKYRLCIIASWGKGWEHVSVHSQHGDKQLTPFWEDMCYAKMVFFKESETVIQYHPPKSKYINNHPYTLHLWRPQNQEIELPPNWMV
jgi:hypothetical protein